MSWVLRVQVSTSFNIGNFQRDDTGMHLRNVQTNTYMIYPLTKT